MKINKVCLLIVCLISIFVYCGCKTLSSNILGSVEKPEIESIIPKITGLDLQGVDLAFDVNVHNPYSVPIKSPGFKYGLDIENSQFINASKTSRLGLPARDTGTVTLPVRVNYADLWRVYQQTKGANEIAYALKGALVLSPFGQAIELPMQKSGTFPVLRMPSISAFKVEPSDISLSKAKIKVGANVTNPNVFNLGLEDLGYALRLGNIDLGKIKATAVKEIGAGETRQVDIEGVLSGIDAVGQLLRGASPGSVSIAPTGFLSTPYGRLGIPKDLLKDR